MVTEFCATTNAGKQQMANSSSEPVNKTRLRFIITIPFVVTTRILKVHHLTLTREDQPPLDTARNLTAFPCQNRTFIKRPIMLQLRSLINQTRCRTLSFESRLPPGV